MGRFICAKSSCNCNCLQLLVSSDIQYSKFTNSSQLLLVHTNMLRSATTEVRVTPHLDCVIVLLVTVPMLVKLRTPWLYKFSNYEIEILIPFVSQVKSVQFMVQ